MFLQVPAHLGFPGQIPQSRKTVVCCLLVPEVGHPSSIAGLLHGMSCVCWCCAILLEDASTGQQLITVVDKTGKETANIACRIQFSALVNKVDLSLFIETLQLRPSHAAQTAHI